ncbi:MAG: 4-alpha-glucanotransferase [Aggregatilineales bacterium]
MTLFPRASGILLHPTSLPGRYGLGDLGEHAYRFVDWLQSAGQSYWQVLPLGPTSYGDSPYQCLSAFAGNSNLISLDKLVGEGWLMPADLAYVPNFPTFEVDYGPVIEFHNKKLDVAFKRFNQVGTAEQKAAYAAWIAEQDEWLENWCLYIAIKEKNGGKAWVEWDEKEALSDPATLKQAQTDLAVRIDAHRWRQWQFYSQWNDLRAYANERGVRIVGDIPIFVAHDSSDVWANRERFYLDAKGNPTVVAGVPPDYFSPTGQYWGNPLYRWDVMEADEYKWWRSRFRATFALVDLVRIDHFRGFESYWEVPVNKEQVATIGKWIKGPNVGFFEVIKKEFGDVLPIIAEDLGDITIDVIILRDTLGLPGMNILQFAWSDPANPFLPHNHAENSIVYTGTHDNNTTYGWWHGEAEDHNRNFVADYLGEQVGDDDPHWTFIRMGMRSVAHTFIAPMQDILGYGEDTRMNVPGKQGGNWKWRFTAEKFSDPGRDYLAHLTWLYRRRADQQEKVYGDPAQSKKQENS